MSEMIDRVASTLFGQDISKAAYPEIWRNFARRAMNEIHKAGDSDDYERNFSGHGRGTVISQIPGGGFQERDMTIAERNARVPALQIAAQIHRLACYAAFAYIETWELIAPAIAKARNEAFDDAARTLRMFGDDESADIVLGLKD